jgi:hypothetical protein
VYLSVRVLIVAISLFGALARAEEANVESQHILDRYVKATAGQREKLRGVTMDVNIAAELPKLQKRGTLFALRTISKVGRITYEALKFEGDNTIKKELIARFLAAETDTSSKGAPPITPEFYKFKFKGLNEREGQNVYVFQLTPKKKLPGTFKGEVWLDSTTYLPVREQGRLAKNPSVFIRRFDFERTYEIREGLAVPKHTHGVVETRLWGKAEMNVDFSNLQELPSSDTSASLTESQLAKTPQ